MRGRDRMHGARPRAAANVLCKEGEVSVALLVCRSSVIAGLVAAAAGMAVGEMTPAPLLMDNLDEDVDVAVGSREPREHGPKEVHLCPVRGALHGLLCELGEVPHDTQLLHSAKVRVRDAPLLQLKQLGVQLHLDPKRQARNERNFAEIADCSKDGRGELVLRGEREAGKSRSRPSKGRRRRLCARVVQRLSRSSPRLTGRLGLCAGAWGGRGGLRQLQ
jgi:hypothetical protein